MQPCTEIETATKSKPKAKQSKAAAPSSSAKMKQPVVVVVEDDEESAMESTETAEKVSEYSEIASMVVESFLRERERER